MPAWRLFLGSPPPPDRIFFHGTWGRGYRSSRYTNLLRHLERLDPFLVPVSRGRVARTVQARLLDATTPSRYRLVHAAANRRYALMFTTDLRQIPYFQGRVVADLDDPRFSATEVELLNRPNVGAYVVTTEGARSRFEGLGVTTPGHVISQGADLRSFDKEATRAVAARHRRPGEVAIGYIARWLLGNPSRDRGRQLLYGLEHVLELWERISTRVPAGRLWLIGDPDRAAREMCADRSDILLLGRIPQDRVLPYIANLDIALYPRRVDHSPMPVKLVEYIALGVPTVSYDLDLAQILRETGAGCLASSPEEFADRVERLSLNEGERHQLSAAGKSVAPSFDWDNLAARYQREVLDRYLS
jgi:glycosyltransferase involved in cell wall biosynthesis